MQGGGVGSSAASAHSCLICQMHDALHAAAEYSTSLITLNSWARLATLPSRDSRTPPHICRYFDVSIAQTLTRERSTERCALEPGHADAEVCNAWHNSLHRDGRVRTRKAAACVGSSDIIPLSARLPNRIPLPSSALAHSPRSQHLPGEGWCASALPIRRSNRRLSCPEQDYKLLRLTSSRVLPVLPPAHALHSRMYPTCTCHSDACTRLTCRRMKILASLRASRRP